jgi:hypothetical protein
MGVVDFLQKVTNNIPDFIGKDTPKATLDARMDRVNNLDFS